MGNNYKLSKIKIRTLKHVHKVTKSQPMDHSIFSSGEKETSHRHLGTSYGAGLLEILHIACPGYILIKCHAEELSFWIMQYPRTISKFPGGNYSCWEAISEIVLYSVFHDNKLSWHSRKSHPNTSISDNIDSKLWRHNNDQYLHMVTIWSDFHILHLFWA